MNKKAFWKLFLSSQAFLYFGFCIIAADADPFNWEVPLRIGYVLLNGYLIFMSAILSSDL